MRKKILFSLFVGLALLFCSSMVKASDTSPYLMGTWEFAVACNAPTGPGSLWYTLVTDFSIVNPTPAPSLVYAVFYSNNNPVPLGCFQHTLNASSEWNLSLSSLPPDQIQWLRSMNSCQPGSAPLSESRGTVSFFAFPVPSQGGRLSLNSDFVIGGFQQKWMIPSARIFSRSEANLNAVEINVITAMTFSNIISIATTCLPWE